MTLVEELSSLNFNDIGSWSRRVRLLMACVVGVLLFIAGYYLVIQPKQVELEYAKSQEKTLKTDFLGKKALAINLDAYKAQKVEAEETFQTLKNQLPNESEIPSLLTDVTQVGLTRGLQFEQIKPGATVTQDFYAEKLVNLKVNGQYHQIANFISDIAALPRIINVESFKLERLSPDSNNLKMSALTKTYYYIGDEVIEEEVEGQ